MGSVHKGNGHLVAFKRNHEGYRIHRSKSFDWDKTWRPTPLPNNNSSISMLRLQSGRSAIAYNLLEYQIHIQAKLLGQDCAAQLQ